ncbi:MAG: ImmA/IrrE family metallo-endopeptidase [Alicyclobacillus sp.]|nr:ImmA/IrrE family metallo-endopeptidase [Alicyclobacillus sp.]
MTTLAERYYVARGILYPHQIDLDVIADELSITVRRMPRPSTSLTIDGQRIVLIDSHLSLPEQREHLAHEIAHHVLHVGSQLVMCASFRWLQEAQAERLAGHILAPDHMLSRYVSEAPHYLECALTYLADVFCAPLRTIKRRIDEWHENGRY